MPSPRLLLLPGPLLLHPRHHWQSRLEGRSACVRPSGGPSWGRLASASPAAVLLPTPWPHRPSCPWGTSIEMQVLGAFFIICGRGRIFFPLSITDGILKITAKRNYSENEIKRQYKTDSTLLLIISTDIKLLCQFSINISKCLRSVFVLSPTLCDNPFGDRRTPRTHQERRSWKLMGDPDACCLRADPAHPMLGAARPPWTTRLSPFPAWHLPGASSCTPVQAESPPSVLGPDRCCPFRGVLEMQFLSDACALERRKIQVGPR